MLGRLFAPVGGVGGGEQLELDAPFLFGTQAGYWMAQPSWVEACPTTVGMQPKPAQQMHLQSSASTLPTSETSTTTAACLAIRSSAISVSAHRRSTDTRGRIVVQHTTTPGRGKRAPEIVREHTSARVGLSRFCRSARQPQQCSRQGAERVAHPPGPWVRFIQHESTRVPAVDLPQNRK